MGWSMGRMALRTVAVGMGASLSLMLGSTLVQAASPGHGGAVAIVADGNSGGGTSGSPGSSSQGDQGNGNNGNGNSQNENGKHNLPETPYAIMFPLAVGAATWIVYRKRRQVGG